MSAELTILLTWTPRIEGESGYIEEAIDGKHIRTYGPMPRDAIGPMIDELQEVYSNIADDMQKAMKP